MQGTNSPRIINQGRQIENLNKQTNTNTIGLEELNSTTVPELKTNINNNKNTIEQHKIELDQLEIRVKALEDKDNGLSELEQIKQEITQMKVSINNNTTNLTQLDADIKNINQLITDLESKVEAIDVKTKENAIEIGKISITDKAQDEKIEDLTTRVNKLEQSPNDIEIDTDDTLSANSDERIASQKATKTYIDRNSATIKNTVDNLLKNTEQKTYHDRYLDIDYPRNRREGFQFNEVANKDSIKISNIKAYGQHYEKPLTSFGLYIRGLNLITQEEIMSRIVEDKNGKLQNDIATVNINSFFPLWTNTFFGVFADGEDYALSFQARIKPDPNTPNASLEIVAKLKNDSIMSLGYIHSSEDLRSYHVNTKGLRDIDSIFFAYPQGEGYLEIDIKTIWLTTLNNHNKDFELGHLTRQFIEIPTGLKRLPKEYGGGDEINGNGEIIRTVRNQIIEYKANKDIDTEKGKYVSYLESVYLPSFNSRTVNNFNGKEAIVAKDVFVKSTMFSSMDVYIQLQRHSLAEDSPEGIYIKYDAKKAGHYFITMLFTNKAIVQEFKDKGVEKTIEDLKLTLCYKGYPYKDGIIDVNSLKLSTDSTSFFVNVTSNPQVQLQIPYTLDKTSMINNTNILERRIQDLELAIKNIKEGK